MPRQSVADLLGEVDQAPPAAPPALPPKPEAEAARQRPEPLTPPARSPESRRPENTLIRVAVDMLLGRAGKLRGTTEDELRKSVTS